MKSYSEAFLEYLKRSEKEKNLRIRYVEGKGWEVYAE